jgi:hypothetical protein
MVFFYMQNKSVDIYNAQFNRLNEYIHPYKKFVSDRIGSMIDRLVFLKESGSDRSSKIEDRYSLTPHKSPIFSHQKKFFPIHYTATVVKRLNKIPIITKKSINLTFKKTLLCHANIGE